MASATHRTKKIRKKKRSTQGTKRKAKNRNEGTTKTRAKLFGDE